MKIQVHTVDVITVQVPFRIVKRGGRKEMVLPEGSRAPSDRQHPAQGAGARLPLEEDVGNRRLRDRW